MWPIKQQVEGGREEVGGGGEGRWWYTFRWVN